MNYKLPLIASFVAVLGLTACGGGGGTAAVDYGPQPAALSKTDTVVGTGATAAVNHTVTVYYTGWLYDSKAADFHGARFDGTVAGSPASFALASGPLIDGWVQGIPGMKVGGKRTLVIPSSLAYGSSGRGTIPPNVGLVFDIELTAVK